PSIEHDDVRRRFFELRARLGERRRRAHLVPLRAERLFAHHAKDAFVVDHEHGCPHVASTGRVSKNDAPASVGSTTSSPPCARAIWQEMGSPSPAPLGFPVPTGSKSRSRNSAATPGPLSSTRSSARPSSAASATVMRGGSTPATASSALETRLPTTI